MQTISQKELEKALIAKARKQMLRRIKVHLDKPITSHKVKLTRKLCQEEEKATEKKSESKKR